MTSVLLSIIFILWVYVEVVRQSTRDIWISMCVNWNEDVITLAPVHTTPEEYKNETVTGQFWIWVWGKLGQGHDYYVLIVFEKYRFQKVFDPSTPKRNAGVFVTVWKVVRRNNAALSPARCKGCRLDARRMESDSVVDCWLVTCTLNRRSRVICKDIGHFRVTSSLFQNESLCKVFHVKMSLICIRINMHEEHTWFHSKTRFQTEAKDNSDMANGLLTSVLAPVYPVQ